MQKNASHTDVDIVIVQKQTTWERYAGRKMNMDFLDYIDKAGQSSDSLLFAHKQHIQSRVLLFKYLDSLNISYIVYNIDELKKNNINFYDDQNNSSGLRPKKNLVISLGGDGTLLHASHHVGGNVRLLGINSCPEHSVGHLCAMLPCEIETSLKSVLNNNIPVESVRRLKIESAIESQLPLALNDALFCNVHPAATSRYQLDLHENPGNRVLRSEKHLSSGVWVATAAGSSAAVSSYGFEPIPISSTKALVAVRELYNTDDSSLRMEKFSFDANKNSLSFFSRMRQSILCVDGPDFCVTMGFGDVASISLPENCSLLLVAKIF